LQYTTQTSLEQICANCFLDQVHIPDSSGTLEYIDDSITRSLWKEWNVITKGALENFMYKFEDGWYIWTQAYFIEDWERGIIYNSKQLPDLIEMILDFTGVPNVYGQTITTSQ